MANENATTMLPQLKPGALVTIQLGSAFINKIQECFQLHVMNNMEDLNKLKAKEGKYDAEPLTPWETIAIMYSTLLQEIMKTAEADGLIEYVSVESMLNEITPQKTHQEDLDQE
jgi:hypothetical protein